MKTNQLSTSPQRPSRVRRLCLVISIIAVCLIAATAFAVPYALHTIHAASPTHATSSCAQPPAGKDLSTMSPKELRGYGLSPALTKQPRWKTIAHHLKHRFCFPTHAPAPVVQHGVMQPQQPDNSFDCLDSCVAGLEGDTPSYFPVTFAHGSWVVPCATFDIADEIVDTWVGIGGLEGSGPMVRVGVRQQKVTATFYPPPANDPVEYAYFQDTADPSTAAIQPGFGVSCGDQVDVYAWVSVQQSVELFAMDDITGDFFDVNVNPNIDATNVACAVEDPADGVGMPWFGSITFSDCEASNNGRGGTGLLIFPSSVQREIYFSDPNSPTAYTVIGEFPDGSIFSVVQPGCSLTPVDTCV